MATWIEKHGAVWVHAEADGRIVSERFDEMTGVLGIVLDHGDGTLRSIVYERTSGSPQWNCLFWERRCADAIFTDRGEAELHITKLIENIRLGSI